MLFLETVESLMKTVENVMKHCAIKPVAANKKYFF